MPTFAQAAPARAELRPRRVRLNLTRRLSILDLSHDGDPWIKRCGVDQCCVVYLQGQPIAMVAAVPFDLASLYNRLYDMRKRSGGRTRSF